MSRLDDVKAQSIFIFRQAFARLRRIGSWEQDDNKECGLHSAGSDKGLPEPVPP